MKKLLFICLAIMAFQFVAIRSFAQNTLDKIGLTAANPAGGAYSVRLLSSTYAGPAMRVRNAGGDATTRDVYFDGTGVVSLNSQVSASGGGAATATTLGTWMTAASSGYVTIWYDQSGNAGNMTQVTAGNQPRIINAGALETKSSIAAVHHIAANSNFMTVATAYLSTNFWSVNVVEGLDGTTNQRMLSGAANWLLGFWNGNQESYYYNGSNSGNTYNSGIAPTTSNQIYTAVGQGAATGLQYCNSVAFTNGSSAASTPPTSLYTSSYQTTSEFSDGTMQELLVFASSITAAVQATIECNQKSYYSISPTTASVGVNQSMCGTLTSDGLGGNTPAAGSGVWTQVSGPGTTTFSNSSLGNSTATASIVGTYVYQWTVTNGGCTALATITVTYAAGGVKPTATISGSAATCGGTSTTISVALTGVAPWNLTYTDGTNFYNVIGIASSPYTFIVTPIVTTTYNVTVLTDASCTALPANISGSAVITVQTVLGTPAQAAAAYSVRNLMSCYTGPAMRVRNVGGDATTRDVYFDGTGVVSLNSPVSAAGGGAATATTLGTWMTAASSGFVTIWYDQTTNARNMTQVTNGNQPRIVLNGALDVNANSLTTQPAIRHIAASSNYLSVSTSYLTTNFWTVDVVEGLDGGASQRMLSGAANWLLGFWNGNESSYYFNGSSSGSSYNSGVAPTTNDEIYMAIGQGASTAVQYKNNAAFTNGVTAPSTPPTSLYTSGYISSNSEFSNGTMQELLIYTSSLSAADQTIIANSQGNFFGTLVLPIELLTFNAVPNGEGVNITWETATEINNNYFTIERSLDGETFIELTKVNSKANHGNSTSPLNYQTTDSKPLNGTSYYRLKQTDYNNNFKTFYVISVNLDASKNVTFVVYPNPNSGEFTVDFSGIENNHEVQIIMLDGTGREVYSQTVYSNSINSNKVKITPSAGIAKGNYECSIIFEGIKRTLIVIVN